ncbi:MAG: hypothetical protein Q7R35_13920 [Elusimicrobiota bacterium]|nr:hypothetical protein [Elusimicrobiota bacterium]
MKNITSIVGWLLLIAVMAVPSFLFYNWWSKGNQQAQAELVREPLSGSVFPAEKNSQGVVARQPSAAPPPGLSPAVQPQFATSAAAAPAAQAPGRPAAQPAQAPAEQPPSASSNPPVEFPRPAQAPGTSTVAAKGVATSTGTKILSYYSPKGTRDPTFSPEDYRRIREEQQRRDEAQQQQQIVDTRKPKEPKPETRINLQGLVGNAAIINGDMYHVGQTVRGVKILKIGTDYIIGEYKGKTFRKMLK